jgi:hypothetical protein
VACRFLRQKSKKKIDGILTAFCRGKTALGVALIFVNYMRGDT